MITLARFASGRRLLGVLGVQPLQYQLLVDLFGTLGERKELVGNLGMDPQALRLASLFLVFPGVILALLAFAPMSLATYETTLLSMSSAVLLLLLVTEASNSFLNPAEVSVLAHRPIQGSTYFAAKLTYLLVIVLRSEVVLNGPAAITGAFKAEARWFYPLTHLAAALATGVFLALVACALFGVMMRVVPLSRLRAAAMWLQLIVSSLPVMFNVLRQPVRALISVVAPITAHVDWSFVPIVWFAACGVAGQGQLSSPIRWPIAGMGMAISGVFIAFGVRALSAGYMTRIVAITRGSRGVGSKSRFSLFGGTIRVLTGSPAGRAGYEFVTRMMRRDWQFRRLMSQTAISIVFIVPLILRGVRSPSPFSGGGRPPRSPSCPSLSASSR